MGGEPIDYCPHCGNDIDPHHPCNCFEPCVCGDYRHQHKDGTGPCKFNEPGRFDLCHGGKDCMQFESAVSETKLIDWRDAHR